MTDLIDIDATATDRNPDTGSDHQRDPQGDQRRDQQRRDALVERLFGAFTLGSELLTIDLGRRLGLYETVLAAGSVTSGELARRSGIHERYAREWLEQQAAAGIIDVIRDAGAGTGNETESALTRRFALPAAHVPVLVDPDHPSNVLGFAPFLTGFALTLPAVVQAYRTGAGVSFDEFGDEVRHGIATLNRPGFTQFVGEWISRLPDVAERLRTGGTVLDAGCGTGWSTVAIARAFPEARVIGIDLDAASIAEARTLITEQGLVDRVHVEVANAADIRTLGVDSEFDLATVFEALHDMGEPVAALQSIRAAIRADGAVLVADELVADRFTSPAGEVERMQFAASVLHCLPATMAESQTIANGTVLRAPTVRSWAADAGFTTKELQIEHDFWRFYRLDPVNG